MSSPITVFTTLERCGPYFGPNPRLETYSIECTDTADVIPRLTTLFSRHCVELCNLSTWSTLKAAGRQGVVVTTRRPAAVTDEALVKRINRLIGVIRVRRETFDQSRKFGDIAIEVSATGYYVDKLATVGYEFNATPLQYSKKCIVMRVSESGKRIDEFLTRLTNCIDSRVTGEIRVSISHSPALVLLSLKSLGG